MGIYSAKWRGGLEELLGYERLEWRKRIVSMSQFLSEDDKVVMDLGAGNMHLKKLLAPCVKYIPVDYKQNSAETIVCDFNRHQFPETHADAIVAAGILGYIDDPYWFLDQICDKTNKLILSYKGKEKNSESLLTTREVISHMGKNGFIITGSDETLKEWTIIGCFERLTPNTLGKQIACTGCGACVNSCPNYALFLDCDDKGFLKPSCNEEKCVQCGVCTKTCPITKKNDVFFGDSTHKYETPDIYAAWARDEVRNESSSGGIFYTLALQILKRGGCVFGATWTENYNLVIDWTEDEADLHRFMHSKYVQSNTTNAFRKVKEKLQSKKTVLYSGTPCQIEGLYSYLGELANSESLYTIDLVCFGVPSIRAFFKYLKESYDVSDIQNIVFRDKKAGEGWSPTGYGIYKKNGDSLYKNGEDSFQKAFHKVLFRNTVCESCTYYKLPRRGDITLGDFWGIQVHDPTWDDHKGTSLVSINSNKAKRLWSEARRELIRVQRVDLEWSQNKGNRFGTDGRSNHPNKGYFDELIKKYTFDIAVERALNGIHDVGIVCVMNYSIGNNITNYALYCVLSDLGYEPQMIDVPYDVPEFEKCNEKGSTHYFLRSPYRNGAVFKAKGFWDLFESDNCEMYILGSDELWRDNFIKSTDYFTTLNWSSPYKKKISVGTSVGTSFDDNDKKLVSNVKKYIKRFEHISVRDSFSKEILNNWGVDSTVVVDPVFLCDRRYFDELANRGLLRIPNKNYCFGYFLDPNKEKENVLQKIASQYSGGSYLAATDPTYTESSSEDIEYTIEPCVEEWIAMVKGADYVVTDSFYGMCFALIYQKPFLIVFESDDCYEVNQFTSFLAPIGLEARFVSQGDHLTELEPIDYKSVDTVIGEMKKKSQEWLENSINSKWIPNLSDYDYYLRIQYENRKIVQKTTQELRNVKSDLFFQSRSHVLPVKNRERKENADMIVGWGAGNCFRNNEEILKEYGHIEFVCDSNPALWGTKLSDGITCISPADLLKMESPFVLIMVYSASAVVSIVNTLIDMGIWQFEHIDNWRNRLSIV